MIITGAMPVDPQRFGAAVRVDSDDIGGVVASENGPEAGVWFIAEAIWFLQNPQRATGVKFLRCPLRGAPPTFVLSESNRQLRNLVD